MSSDLQINPKSRILEKGYINVYSNLSRQEKMQLHFKRLFKNIHPEWEETQVYLAKKFSELVPVNAVVLDAGCGNGNYVIDENREKISWAIGVDVSEEAVRKNICLDEIRISSLEELPFADDTFDAVVSLWVVEHLQNPDKVFKEVYRVLKPGGIFLFSTPNRNFFFLRIISLLKAGGILNKYLFGRQKEDVFPAYYRSNTVKEIRKLSSGRFDTKELFYNYDPSYTSFNTLTFRISVLAKTIFDTWGMRLLYPHIVGILVKK